MVHIEKISLRGFKSFGNKRVGIPISKGFTAVVGPNGSGKSNVVDAICFVLGRMSTKSMRAERLTDLIWAGNDNFPEGSYTEVSLHLNNPDRKLPIDEPKVVVSRRVDRSGRSVYRANKNRMTRKEIVDILAMADIFPDGYNIVLQGDITKLVKMTPVERRMLIDELSGVAEYDSKREKAMKELSKAEENIRATNLVIDEVLSQLRRLERERDEAVRYQDLITQIRELKWQYQHNQLRRYRERYDAILEKTKKGQERIDEIQNQIDDINTEIREKEEKQEKLERLIEKRQESDQEKIGQQIEEVRAQIVRAQENMKNTKENLDKQRTRKGELESEIESATEKIRDNRNRVKSLEAQRGKVQESLENLRSKRKSLEEKISERQAETSNLRKEVQELDEVLKTNRQRERTSREERSKAEMKVHQARERVSHLEESIEEQSERLETLQARRREQRGKKSLHEDGVNELASEMEELRGRIEEHKRALSGIDGDLKMKSNRLTRMKAYLKAAQESENPRKRAISNLMVEKEKGNVQGLLGTISQMTDVPDEYRLPIFAALDNRLEYLVVEDRESARKCIEYLKENEIGWADFIPLDEIQDREKNEPNISVSGEGVIGPAMDFVEFKGEVGKVLQFLLGKTYLTRKSPWEMDTKDVDLVSVDGEVHGEMGVMSGGYRPYSGHFDSMLDFSHEDLKQLEEEVRSFESEKNRVQTDLEELNSGLVSCRERHAEHKSKLDSVRRDIENLESEIQEVESRVGNLQESRENALEDLSRAQKKTKEAKSKEKEASDALRETETRRDRLVRELEDSEMNRLDQELRNVTSSINQEIERESELNSEIVSLNRETEYLENGRGKYRKDLQEIEKSVEGLELVLDKIKKDIPKLEEELSQLKESQGEIRNQVKQLRSTIFSEKSDLSDLVQERDSLSEDKNRLTVEVNSSVYERSQLDVDIHKLENEMEMMDYEYEPVEIDELEKISKKISALDVEKSKLEPVNMRAIESYEETEVKFNEYKERRDKVMEEREAILHFMEEIERKKKQVFMNAFENIAANFQTIFAKLSPGGEGKLVLEDYDDPFSGGLEIEAKPAGKEVNAIDSMSGGEKALTAIAFIFSIQAYKPSPFYILDEIDAHLDDENVKRVAELIADTARDSQFIIVTLRDSMMALADELIGVSMQDNGVSKVVGVRMEAGEIVEGATGNEVEAGGAEV